MKYDSTNPQHESWLMELWSLYLPRGPAHPNPPARVTPDWGLLGFQGSDPATDFRGMGVLGLRNLMEFARAAPIHAGIIMRRAQEQGLKWFGFAITGINLTADLVALAKDHTLDAYFYAYGANWASWHALYCTFFVKFDEFWQEAKPENVMSYSTVHSAFLSSFALEARSFPFSPRDVASKGFSLSAITPVTPRHAAMALSASAAAAAAAFPCATPDDDEGAFGDDELEREIGATRVSVTSAIATGTASSSRRSSGRGIIGSNLAASALSRSSSASPSSFSLRPRSRSVSLAFSRSGVSRSFGGGVSGGCDDDEDDDDFDGSGPGSPTSPMSMSRSGELDGSSMGEPSPLGNWLDPVIPPKLFARHKLPQWTAR